MGFLNVSIVGSFFSEEDYDEESDADVDAKKSQPASGNAAVLSFNCEMRQFFK